MSALPMRPVFFRTPADFRRWLAKRHATERAILVGFRKKGSGLPSITYPEALDEALCFGWIDGVRRSIDESTYTIRFTPRKPKSNWSRVNVRHVRRLIREGRMRPAGLRAFEARKRGAEQLYSFEARGAGLDPKTERALRRDSAAWRYWRAHTPSYRKAASWWVASAKREETRARRRATLVACSADGRDIPLLGGQRRKAPARAPRSG